MFLYPLADSSLDLVFSVLFLLVGLLMGSFANVVILRYLTGESVVDPLWSRCLKCGKQIQWFDNIPVISWLVLRGRCRYCGVSISWQYPIVESLMGILFYLVYHYWGISWTSMEMLVFVWLLVVVSVIDLRSFLLPDVFTVTGIFLGIGGAILNADRMLLDSIMGVFLGGGFFWLLSVIYFRLRGQVGLGGGDVKLLAMMGAYLGWQKLPLILLVSSLIGSLAGLWAMRRSKKGLKTVIPFGPSLAAGGIFSLFFDGNLVQNIFNLFN